MDHDKYMLIALEEARKAAVMGEIPVGALLVLDGQVIARGHNERETTSDPLAHAEMVVLRRASAVLGTWRLDRSVLYVTLEPCPMCSGAIMQSRVSTIVYGARDARAGCCGTLYNLPEDRRFPAKCKIIGGVLGSECANILGGFFLTKRKVRDLSSGGVAEWSKAVDSKSTRR